MIVKSISARVVCRRLTASAGGFVLSKRRHISPPCSVTFVLALSFCDLATVETANAQTGTCATVINHSVKFLFLTKRTWPRGCCYGGARYCAIVIGKRVVSHKVERRAMVQCLRVGLCRCRVAATLASLHRRHDA